MRPFRRVAFPDSDRGQLILAGAFIIAITFIAITIVLTASNYTTTLSDENDFVAQGGDAVSTREAVETDLERRFAYIMANYDDEEEREDQFRWTVENMSGPLQDRHSRRGRYVNVTQEPYSEPFIEGTRLSDNFELSGGGGASFTKPNGGEANWEMANDVQVRNITFVVTGVKDSAQGRENAFNLSFQNPKRGNWTFRVWQNVSDTGRVIYEVESPSGYTETCEREEPGDESGHVIDFQDGTITEVFDDTTPVSVKPCPAFTAIDLDSQHYDVNITGGGAASGRYSLVVDEPPTSSKVNDGYFDPDEAGAEETLYGARVNYEYYSPTVTYNATIEVAPEEFE